MLCYAIDTFKVLNQVESFNDIVQCYESNKVYDRGITRLQGDHLCRMRPSFFGGLVSYQGMSIDSPSEGGIV